MQRVLVMEGSEVEGLSSAVQKALKALKISGHYCLSNQYLSLACPRYWHVTDTPWRASSSGGEWHTPEVVYPRTILTVREVHDNYVTCTFHNKEFRDPISYGRMAFAKAVIEGSLMEYR